MSVSPAEMVHTCNQADDDITTADACVHSDEISSVQRRIMKPARRRLFITSLGVFQIIVGVLFISLGAWAILETKSSVKKTAAAPFWMTGLCFFSGYLAIVTPCHYHKQWVSVLICSSAFVCLVSTTVAAWMFVSLIGASHAEEMSYTSLVMGLNVLLMLDTGIVATSTWSAREAGGFNSEHQRSERAINLDLPPPYYPGRMIFFGNDEFMPPPSEAGAPPPYEP